MEMGASTNLKEFTDTTVAIETVANYLNHIIENKKTKNPLLSLRSLSKKMDLSVAMLSSVLNGSKHLSIESAFKISKWLDLSGSELEYFMDLIQFETIKSEEIKSQLARKIRNRYLYTFTDKTTEVSKILSETCIQRLLPYGIPQNHINRSLCLLKNRISGQPSPHFYDTFIDAEWPYAGSGFFIYNQTGKFYQAYVDSMKNKSLQMKQYYPQNNHLLVDWCEKGLPTIRSVAIRTRFEYYHFVDMAYTEETCILRGETLYPNEALRTEPFEMIYYRFL